MVNKKLDILKNQLCILLFLYNLTIAIGLNFLKMLSLRLSIFIDFVIFYTFLSVFLVHKYYVLVRFSSLPGNFRVCSLCRCNALKYLMSIVNVQTLSLIRRASETADPGRSQRVLDKCDGELDESTEHVRGPAVPALVQIHRRE